MSLLSALASNLCFSFASVYFARYAHKTSVMWMNFAKTLVAATLLSCICLIFVPSDGFVQSDKSILFFLASGILGLGIGDFLLFKGFVLLGPTRTLMLYTFQPMVFTFIDSLNENGILKWNHYLAIFLFLFCVYIFSYQELKTQKKWISGGLLLAISGVCLDGLGVYGTKFAFELSPNTHPLVANWTRSLGAMIFFILYQFFYPLRPFKILMNLTIPQRKEVAMACFLGTFLSLNFYMMAIKFGELSMVTSIAVTGPIFAALFERVIDKKILPKTLWWALAVFIAAFFCSLI